MLPCVPRAAQEAPFLGRLGERHVEPAPGLLLGAPG